MKFYSGKGDNGTSTLFSSGKRILKTDKIFEALGALDELNSYLGICKSLAQEKKIKDVLREVQEKLFIIQAEIGGAKNIAGITEKNLMALEKKMDEFCSKVGIITKFTLAGGTPLSTHLDYARAICRSAERTFLASRLPLGARDTLTVAYLNRISSLLFVLARYANKKAGVKEDNPKYK